MKWTRLPQPRSSPIYFAGDWQIGRTDTGEWWGEGPGVDGVFPTKKEAQIACQRSYDEYGRHAL